MIKKKTALLFLGGLMVSLWFCSFPACRDAQEKAEETGDTSSFRVLRFEQDLFTDSISGGSRTSLLRNRYGSYFELFVWQITRLGSKDSMIMDRNLQSFVSDTNFRAVYNACQAKYGDFTPYEKRFRKAFAAYRKEFPDQPVPQVLTTLSVFSYPVICDSTHLAVSLDMYLNPGSRFYPTVEPPFPAYLQRRMCKEYIVADGIKGWLQSDYMSDEVESDLLEKMISQGRVQYALKRIVAEEPDSVLTGYTADQLEWCAKNEAQVWSFFIDNKLLYSKDPNVMMKYVGEGPSTNGFPEGSPGNIGLYLGLRIVESYMSSHSSTSLSQLMTMKDLHELFLQSKYKPKK